MKRYKKNYSIYCLFVLSLCICSSAYADLYWQKTELESRISKKVRNAVKGLLEREAFIVDVKIELEETAPPVFDDNENNNGLKISNIKLDESAGDYIALAKVGLEVPILEKYKKDEKIKNYFKKLFKYKENLELEKLIQKVSITLFIDSTIEAALLEKIKSIVNGLNIKVGSIPAVYTFNKSTLMLKKEIAKNNTPVKKTKDLLYYVEKFALSIGLVLATFFLGIFGYILLKKWGAIIRENLELENENSMNDDKDDEKEDEDEIMSVQNGDDNNEDLVEEKITQSTGIERFKNLFESDKGSLIVLVKKWITQSSEDSMLILGLIVQSLSNDELLSVFELLGDEYRLKWKNMLINNLSSAEEKTAEILLADAIVSEIVSGEKISDQELLDIIISLSTEDAVSFINENTDLGAELVCFLSPNMVSKILDSVDEQLAFSLLEKSVNIESEAINEDKLKETLRSYTSNSKYNPFVQKIKDMFAHISANREEVLFKALALEVPVNVLRKMAQKLIPSNLILDFPEHIMKNILQKYPLKEKVELLFTLEGETGERILESLAKKGTNAREMIDFEMNILNSNDLEQKRVLKNSDEIWAKFVLYSRRFLEGNDNYNDELEVLVDDYINKYYEDSSRLKEAS